MNPILEAMYEGVLDGDQAIVEDNVQAALAADIPAGTILTEGLIAAMREVGELFEEGEYFVPEMLIAARAMKGGLKLLRPHLVAADVQPAGKIIAGTIQGDLHDIGKNLVCMMLEGAGFEIIDLGTDVPPEKFVEAVQREQADIIAMSALLTTTMPNMEQVVTALEAANLRESVKVMIGGAPITQTFADNIGADGYAPDASRATALAKSLMGLA
jgi:5-methyltetrahydrofolate--homocysteine methyltransferase